MFRVAKTLFKYTTFTIIFTKMSNALTNTTIAVATGIADDTEENLSEYILSIIVLVFALIVAGGGAIGSVYLVFDVIYFGIKEIKATYQNAVRQQSDRRGR